MHIIIGSHITSSPPFSIFFRKMRSLPRQFTNSSSSSVRTPSSSCSFPHCSVARILPLSQWRINKNIRFIIACDILVVRAPWKRRSDDWSRTSSSHLSLIHRCSTIRASRTASSSSSLKTSWMKMENRISIEKNCGSWEDFFPLQSTGSTLFIAVDCLGGFLPVDSFS